MSRRHRDDRLPLRRDVRPLDAQAAMIRALRTEIATSGWFARLPSRRPPVIKRKLQFVPIFLSVLGLGLLASSRARSAPRSPAVRSTAS
jgi:hypothetical protein